jgi:hypothetical protein
MYTGSVDETPVETLSRRRLCIATDFGPGIAVKTLRSCGTVYAAEGLAGAAEVTVSVMMIEFTNLKPEDRGDPATIGSTS